MYLAFSQYFVLKSQLIIYMLCISVLSPLSIFDPLLGFSLLTPRLTAIHPLSLKLDTTMPLPPTRPEAKCPFLYSYTPTALWTYTSCTPVKLYYNYLHILYPESVWVSFVFLSPEPKIVSEV